MKHIHFGITDTLYGFPWDLGRGVKDLPLGFVTDGDSFLSWGEGRDPRAWNSEDWTPDDLCPPYDSTLHVIANLLDDPDDMDDRFESLSELISDLRETLRLELSDTERLIDYVVVTDSEDWAEDQRVWLLDGTMTEKENE